MWLLRRQVNTRQSENCIWDTQKNGIVTSVPVHVIISLSADENPLWATGC